MLSALPALVHVASSVTTSTYRDTTGLSVWSDSGLRARAGASAPRSVFALVSSSSSTLERWSVNMNLGESKIQTVEALFVNTFFMQKSNLYFYYFAGAV